VRATGCHHIEGARWLAAHSLPRLWLVATLPSGDDEVLAATLLLVYVAFGAAKGAPPCPPDLASTNRGCCLSQSPNGKVQRPAARTGEKPVVIGFVVRRGGIPPSAPVHAISLVTAVTC